MGDGRVGGKCCFDSGRIGRAVLGKVEDHALPADHVKNSDDALAVSAVVGHEHLAVLRHQCAECGLDGKSAAALKWNADMAVLPVHDTEEIFTDRGGHRVEGLVPGTPVAQHGSLGGDGGGQWSRGQKNGIGHDELRKVRERSRHVARGRPPHQPSRGRPRSRYRFRRPVRQTGSGCVGRRRNRAPGPDGADGSYVRRSS